MRVGAEQKNSKEGDVPIRLQREVSVLAYCRDTSSRLARSGNKSPSIGWRARRRKSDGRSELKYWLDEHQGEASEKSVVGPGLDSISRAFEFDGRNATALAAAAAVHYERFKTVTFMMCPDHGTYKHIHHHGKWVVWRRLTSSHRFIQ